MAVNTKKQGYSTIEVGQIIGRNYASVRRMVTDGVIKGHIFKTRETDKRTIVRIPRDALVEYLSENRDIYDDSLLKQFGIDTANAEESGKPVSTPGTSVAIEPGSNLDDIEPCGTYTIDDDDCCGVVPTVKTSIPTYELLVNGRICVANVQKGTAIDILRTLSSDPVFQFTEITVRKGK